MNTRELVTDYKELRVYRSAFEVAMQIFILSKKWPPEEPFALTDQIRRSSRSVCSNIAESWFKRRYPKHFVSKLSDASMEAGETLTWLDFAEACGYLPDEEVIISITQSYRAVIGGLTKMIDHPEQWCITSSVRADPSSYNADSGIDEL